MVDWQEWMHGDKNAVIEEFIDHLLDPKTYRDIYSEDDIIYNSAEEEADMVDDIRYLCAVPEITYPAMEQVLGQMVNTQKGRWSIFAGIQSDLEIRPQHFKYAKTILLSNLTTQEGFSEFLFCLLEVFDFFSAKERARLLKQLKNRKNPLIDLLSALNEIIAGHGYRKIDLGELLVKMKPLLVFDVKDIYGKMEIFFSLLSDLSQVIPSFQGFRQAGGTTTNIYHSIFQQAIFLQQYPPFKKVCLEDAPLIQSLKDQLISTYRYHFDDEISRNILSDPNREHDASLPLESCLSFFSKFLEISRSFRDVLNFSSSLKSDYFHNLHKNMRQLKESTQYMYYLPVRIAAKKILEMFSEQLDAAEKTYSTLKIYMESKRDTISIIGPFGTEGERTMNLYMRISSKLRLLGYQPRFIPGNYNGIVNAILFDIFVNMSAGIICLYKPSKSGGHIDEVARLLERRISPPVALISPCRFPTTTQVEGILRSKHISVFCFKEGSSGLLNCPKKQVCVFKKRCKAQKYPVDSLEKALSRATTWIEKMRK